MVNRSVRIAYSTCSQGVHKVKVKVKNHVIRALFWILGMSYSVFDGLVEIYYMSPEAIKGVSNHCHHWSYALRRAAAAIRILQQN